MERPCLWVINNSPSIQETISIVLGEDYRVRALSCEEYVRDPSKVREADLLVLEADALPQKSVTLLPPDTPVLWLLGPGSSLSTFPDRAAALPYPFRPDDLRARTQALLAHRAQVPSTSGARSNIEYPVLPKEALLLAHRAAGTSFPVLICGEPGTGKARLARAIHSLGRSGQFLMLSASSCTAAALQQVGSVTPGNLTVFIDEISSVTAEGTQLLFELIDCGGLSSNAGWHAVRLICATAQSFEGLARMPGFSQELLYRISVFPITLPPLRERTSDIPTLAEHIATELARGQSIEPVTFTQRAIERLVRYLWFGNLAEFETVLTRSVVLAQRPTIDAADLLFGYGRIVPRPDEEPAAAKEVAPEAATSGAVDLIINELAHEFKNPMVTIKTVAQHLERLLADETGREQVARLTGEAVDRMDRALENLLQFTRFRVPAPGDVALNAILSPCLTELAPALAERRLLLNYRPADSVAIFVDAAQIGYAFDNLLRVITRELPEGQTLSVRPLEGTAGVTFEFGGARNLIAGKLAQLLDHAPADAASLLPLGLVFAKTLIERNGGRIQLDNLRDVTAISVWLPSREEIAPRNGKTASLNN
ncbi:MAG TPA: sigma 54-interacting transcriptional regulator [Candidatus Binatia bacterium]